MYSRQLKVLNIFNCCFAAADNLGVLIPHIYILDIIYTVQYISTILSAPSIPHHIGASLNNMDISNSVCETGNVVSFVLLLLLLSILYGPGQHFFSGWQEEDIQQCWCTIHYVMWCVFAYICDRAVQFHKHNHGLAVQIRWKMDFSQTNTHNR